MTRFFRHLLLVRRFGRTFSPHILNKFSSQAQTKIASCLNESAIQNYLNKKVECFSDSFHGAINNVPVSYVTNLYSIRKELHSNLSALKSLKGSEEHSKEMLAMILEEENKYVSELEGVELELLNIFAPPPEDGDAIIVEITAGVGGKEAALFSNELFEMYCNYADFKNWSSFVDEADVSELGGIRHAKIFMEGQSALRHLYQESGVHRVQRVPETDKSGRIHTSTATVAVFPQTSLAEIQVSERDISVETMRASGAGGQHVNKTDSAVRITHIPSGLVVECQEDRSQIKNKQTALQKLKFRLNDRMKRDHDAKMRGSRKSQVGTKARSDKVRTYNFPQDRITDHRLSQTFHNVPSFLKGENLLDATITKLIDFSEEERLDEFVQLIKENKI